MSDNSENMALAQKLYAAFAAHDGKAILDVLSPTFVGDVSPGMPLGVGGRHEGPQQMLDETWIPVFRAYDVCPEADEFVEAGDRIVALGAYRGTERSTGESFEAPFAHVIDISDGRITALQQITDTASWPS